MPINLPVTPFPPFDRLRATLLNLSGSSVTSFFSRPRVGCDTTPRPPVGTIDPLPFFLFVHLGQRRRHPHQ